MSILLAEPGYEDLIEALIDGAEPVISAATVLEASIVMLARTGDRGVANLDALLTIAGARVVAFDQAQARAAREAYARFGKGRGPARLNLGDCFSYALAKVTGRPLLFKGSDFAMTDVTPAAA